MFFPGQHFSHPDILRTEFNGMKRKFGGRHNSCPNSTTYRYYAQKLAAKLAERYNLEADAIRKITPDIPITTNLMGFYKPFISENILFLMMSYFRKGDQTLRV